MPFSRIETHQGFAEGTHALRAGDLTEALEQFKLVYSQSEADGDADLMAASLCEIAWTCFKLGDAEQGLECAIGAKWLWRRLDNPPELVRSLAVEAVLFLELGFVDEAYELSSEAVGLARSLDAPSMLAFALSAHGLALSLCREAQLASQAFSEAIAIADGLGNATGSAYYRVNLGFAHAKLADEARDFGDLDVARAELEQARALTCEAVERALDAADYWILRVARCNAAEFMAGLDDITCALEMLQRCDDIPTQAGPSLQCHQLYTTAYVQLAHGSLSEAREACEKALSLADARGQVDHQVNCSEILSRILEAQGETAAALAMHRQYHRHYVVQSGESARRRARIEEIRSETDSLRARAAELADLALSDPLTGIANRRSFDQILNRLAGTPFAVAIMDLDNFKQVNDRHTHIIGDAVLQKVAGIMLRQIGPHGHVARLGGEEFALVFPDAPAATAIAFCQGLRIAIANADWSDMADNLVVTVSIGIAVGDGAQPSGELMQIADRWLYEAKSQGRNRVLAGKSPDLLSAPIAAQAAGI
ncbi:MAG: diguanylate cyclase [Devosia sp.]|uniref:GGDEF domain-containing protein n=1 Tax=Devosia sp. TaxID=1871048 RepID=UPI0024C602C9|nr:diguanylate cyclase [Devosia sp.]UYN99777.1 MAG: diguanylate cyclase [Devosia sp.]